MIPRRQWSVSIAALCFIALAGVSAGIGFAIPSAVVQKVDPVLIQTGHYEPSWLGMSGTSLTPELAKAMGLKPEQPGVLVADVVPGSPADRAGLHSRDRQVTIEGERVHLGGDVIAAVDEQPVTGMEDLQPFLQLAYPDQQLALTLLRDDHQIQVEVMFGERHATRR
jgi:serine protease Do